MPQQSVKLSESQMERLRVLAGERGVRFNDMRHSFGTRIAASGVPLRTLQEWMGHRDFKTRLICADYAPSPHEGEMVEAAFRGPIRGPELSEPEMTSDDLTVPEKAESELTDPAP